MTGPQVEKSIQLGYDLFSLLAGLGQVGRPSDAGAAAATPWLGRTARQMAELTNAIQKFFIEHSRLGIPVMFHEECLHGHAAREGTSSARRLITLNLPSQSGASRRRGKRPDYGQPRF